MVCAANPPVRIHVTAKLIAAREPAVMVYAAKPPMKTDAPARVTAARAPVAMESAAPMRVRTSVIALTTALLSAPTVSARPARIPALARKIAV